MYTAVPKPFFHINTVSAFYGSSVSLPCTIDDANPAPSFYWEHVSEEDSLNETINDGTLQLKNIQKSGIYQCTAYNGYGSSIQIVELSKFRHNTYSKVIANNIVS